MTTRATATFEINGWDEKAQESAITLTDREKIDAPRPHL